MYFCPVIKRTSAERTDLRSCNRELVKIKSPVHNLPAAQVANVFLHGLSFRPAGRILDPERLAFVILVTVFRITASPLACDHHVSAPDCVAVIIHALPSV